MRILLVNHAKAASFSGGDGLQLRQTAHWLRRFGWTVDCVDSDRPACAGYDLMHLFNCRFPAVLASQMQAAQSEGLPVVLSPIWIPLAEAIWGSRTAEATLLECLKQPGRSDQMLKTLQRRNFHLKLPGRTLIYPNADEQLERTQMQIADALKPLQGLLPNSFLELQSFRRDLRWHGSQMEVAPSGVDPTPFLSADPALFRAHTGIKGSFVLQAGRVEPAKNQAMLLWALRETSLPVVLAGRTDLDSGYVNLCREIGGDQVYFVGHLPTEMLASAYTAAACHALPSWCETCGLVSLEAALCGAPVVGSTVGHEVEYLQGDAWFADPANPIAIRQAVEEAMIAGRSSARVRRLQRRVLENYSWLKTAERTESLYKKVLGAELLSGIA